MELLKDLGTSYPKPNSKIRRRYGLYKCECNNEFKTRIDIVNQGTTKSCPQCSKKRTAKHNSKHNLCKHPLYTTWSNIRRRCNDKKAPYYKNYGGRGITVCKEWYDFMTFYNWAINNGWQNDLSIDRTNNNEGYSPNNCRFVTKDIQQSNTRKLNSKNTSGYRGVTYSKPLKKWLCQISVKNKYIYLGYHNCKLQAAYTYDKYVRDNNLEHTKNFT